MATVRQQTAPQRLGPFYHRQASLGGKFTQDRFGWARAERFTDPKEEKRTAEQGVGVGDLSHLTKLSINDGRVAETLSNLYKKETDIPIGVVLTDGPDALKEALCAVLCKDEAMLITSPSSKEAVSSLINVRSPNPITVTDMTSVLACAYIIGEKSKSVLQKLTELNVNAEDFPNLTTTHSPLRHVPSIVVRFDLGGATGYQIYFERAYGEYLWDTIFGAGKEFDIIPVGSAAMELLGWSLE